MQTRYIDRTINFDNLSNDDYGFLYKFFKAEEIKDKNTKVKVFNRLRPPPNDNYYIYDDIENGEQIRVRFSHTVFRSTEINDDPNNPEKIFSYAVEGKEPLGHGASGRVSPVIDLLKYNNSTQKME